MDLVVTVCDNAAGEVCPIWPGHPSKVHIGFPDPADAEGSHEERLAVFRDVYGQIEAKIRKLIEVGPERAGEV
jgi:arsenate reductase